MQLEYRMYPPYIFIYIIVYLETYCIGQLLFQSLSLSILILVSRCQKCILNDHFSFTSGRLGLSAEVDLKKLRFFSVPHNGGSHLVSPVDAQLLQAQKTVSECVWIGFSQMNLLSYWDFGFFRWSDVQRQTLGSRSKSCLFLSSNTPFRSGEL